MSSKACAACKGSGSRPCEHGRRSIHYVRERNLDGTSRQCQPPDCRECHGIGRKPGL